MHDAHSGPLPSAERRDATRNLPAPAFWLASIEKCTGALSKKFKKDTKKLVVPGLRYAWLEVEMWFRGVSRRRRRRCCCCLSSSSSSSSSCQTLRTPPGLRLPAPRRYYWPYCGTGALQTKGDPRWVHTNWVMCSEGVDTTTTTQVEIALGCGWHLSMQEILLQNVRLFYWKLFVYSLSLRLTVCIPLVVFITCF